MTEYVPPADRDLLPLRNSVLRELAIADDKRAAAARAELERRKQNRQRKRAARKSAPPPEQVTIDEELEAAEGFDGWDVFATGPA